MVKILKVHGLVWFVWFDLGLRALNFITVRDQYSDQGGHRAARAAKKNTKPEQGGLGDWIEFSILPFSMFP